MDSVELKELERRRIWLAAMIEENVIWKDHRAECLLALEEIAVIARGELHANNLQKAKEKEMESRPNKINVYPESDDNRFGVEIGGVLASKEWWRRFFGKILK